MNRPVGIVKGMVTKASESSARDRLLRAANELFYEEGVHSVGIDRVIERAGVAKASLYSTFGSKDELVRAYLEARATTRQERIVQRIARHHTPRTKILAIFDLIGEIAAEPSFRGCAFVNVSAETPSSKVRKVCRDSRAWVRATFTELARQGGASDPEGLGRKLVVLYDGAIAGEHMDRDGAVAIARDLAAALLDKSR